MIDLQIATTATGLPTEGQFQQWLSAATRAQPKTVEITIRLVDDEESQTLNQSYRGKDKPTNILSFPADMESLAIPELAAELGDNLYLGDLVINAPLVAREAQAQNKTLIDHWAHLVIHGCLHLQGYDHINDAEAEVMESLEIDLLAALGIANPYG